VVALLEVVGGQVSRSGKFLFGGKRARGAKKRRGKTISGVSKGTGWRSLHSSFKRWNVFLLSGTASLGPSDGERGRLPQRKVRVEDRRRGVRPPGVVRRQNFLRSGSAKGRKICERGERSRKRSDWEPTGNRCDEKKRSALV